MVVTSMHIDNTGETVSVRYDEETKSLFFFFQSLYSIRSITQIQFFEMEIKSEILNKIVRDNVKLILKEMVDELD